MTQVRLIVEAMVRNPGAIGLFYRRNFAMTFSIQELLLWDIGKVIKQRISETCELSHILGYTNLDDKRGFQSWTVDIHLRQQIRDSQAQDPGTLPEIRTPSGSDGVIGIDKSGDLVYNT